MMKHIEKRISALEVSTPEKELISLGEYLNRERTTGTNENKEFLSLYNDESE